jgi:hypothetical protein
MTEKICDECNGNGVLTNPCPDCGGYPSKTEDGNCDRCLNEGFIESTCSACHGSGVIDIDES